MFVKLSVLRAFRHDVIYMGGGDLKQTEDAS